jgi:hypothetical protein
MSIVIRSLNWSRRTNPDRPQTHPEAGRTGRNLEIGAASLPGLSRIASIIEIDAIVRYSLSGIQNGRNNFHAEEKLTHGNNKNDHGRGFH